MGRTESCSVIALAVMLQTMCCPVLGAATEGLQASPEEDRRVEVSQTDPPATEPVDSSTTVKPSPEATLAAPSKTKISSAIRDFKPSEEISADNAVPFPIDI